MQGAREYASLIPSGQYGRLFVRAGSHARGSTFHIWVLPEGKTLDSSAWPGDDSVEVYGICGGQPGWTEWYGWLHTGPWQKDFANLVSKKKAERAEKDAAREAEKQAAAAAEESSQAIPALQLQVMNRSALHPYLVPLGLVLAAHLLWLGICGGFTAIHQFITSLPYSIGL